MAQANFNLGNIDQARAFAGDLERNYPDYLPAKLMQAQISLASGDAKAAQRLASELIVRVDQTAPDRKTLRKCWLRFVPRHISRAARLHWNKATPQRPERFHDGP